MNAIDAENLGVPVVPIMVLDITAFFHAFCPGPSCIIARLLGAARAPSFAEPQQGLPVQERQQQGRVKSGIEPCLVIHNRMR